MKEHTVSTASADFTPVFKALAFSADRHRDQRRKGSEASPYINHLIDVAERLWVTGGVRDIPTIAAAILHDTVEDTGTTGEELAAAFGEGISAVVMELTDDKSLPDDERKRRQVEHAAGLSFPARLIKIADKSSNIADIMTSPPVGWSAGRRRRY
ncbi:MAG: bifunctional (p)ppGpp synthetase/guanosine-3',5'-bis(diphosphate) 3'-pyrophosphohydrolase, partial [Candidatus Latescibacteria bacterium]|nr:bifunctional (p)ppGpp synthetase/guanosine-3',5'-bis(diphosphate) 3'-pyrophosphohydrolase [Candidatus Latescibacterota bacterium]